MAPGSLAIAVLLVACSGERSFEEPVVLGGRAISPEVLNRGEYEYMRYCRGCHGQQGRGDGPYASSMSPRPRDLTRGEYPHLGATEGRLPTDEALRGLITHGIAGTAMGAQPLSGEALEGVVQYLKTLAPAWRDSRQLVQ